MKETSYWVVKGRVDDDPFSREGIDTPEALMQRAGGVYVKTGANGTTIRWAMFASNWSSLFYMAEMLMTLPSPYTFEFYMAGWFMQTIRDPNEASLRLHDLVGKSDIHLRQKTFVKEMQPGDFNAIPTIIGDTISNRCAFPEHSVDCVYDDVTKRFVVERIGHETSLAKLYGLSPSSYPCLNGHSYDNIVSQAYKRVMDQENPVYDHVMAVFPVRDDVNKWMGYQRVIVPHVFPDGRKGVSVVTEFADVAINLL